MGEGGGRGLLFNRTNESHDQRISYLKTEIASTMSEYDTLLRSKPEVLSAAENDEAFDLTARTQQMKDKMNELEQLHGSVMLELGKKRDEILNAVAAQIDALEAGKADSLRKYEDEISGISLAYDALCRDEKARQDVLSQEIAKASEEQRLFLENMHNEELSAIEDFESEKRHLDEIHQESLKSSSEQFAAISEELKRSFGKLVSERDGLFAGNTCLGVIVCHFLFFIQVNNISLAAKVACFCAQKVQKLRGVC